MKPLRPLCFCRVLTLFVLLVLLSGTVGWNLPDKSGKHVSIVAHRFRPAAARIPLPDSVPVCDLPAACFGLDLDVLLLFPLALPTQPTARAPTTRHLQNLARAPPAQV
jgi:hypothetical protein